MPNLHDAGNSVQAASGTMTPTVTATLRDFPSAPLRSWTSTWNTNPDGKRLSQDTLMRISLVIIGIYSALNIYLEKPWADRWITLQNDGSMFAGRTPLEHMLRQGQPGMVDVRRMLDACCSGH
jgi:Protein of unknown function (DUF2384)